MGVYCFMSLFSQKPAVRYGAILEIGSGSTAIAIVASDPKSALPTFIWHKRVNASLRDVENLHDSAKSILAALVDLLLEFETTGRPTLAKAAPGAKIEYVQCTIASPWSYTVTKKINYEQDEPFEVTPELLHELANGAKEKSEETVAEHQVASELGLTIATKATLNTFLNGYATKSPEFKQASKLTLVHTSMVTQTYLLDAIKDVQQKVFPNTNLEIFTYASVFNCVVADALPQHRNVALLDVTHEATEISMVREGILSYVTHTPYGLYSLARELSAITGDPLSQAHKLLYREDFADYVAGLSKTKQAEIETLFTNYVEQLQELLQQTGDELAAPRHIMLHAPTETITLFSDLITRASRKATKVSPAITDITSDLKRVAGKQNPDAMQAPAMLVSAYFFHHGNHCFTIEKE